MNVHLVQLIGVGINGNPSEQRHLIGFFFFFFYHIPLSETSNISESSPRNPPPIFFHLGSLVLHHNGSSVDNIHFPSSALPFFFAFITAAHRHALWVNCHLRFAYGAMKPKQWWKQTTITVAWILYWSKALCTEARKRMFHPRSSFDWNCGYKWVFDSWGIV